LSTSLLSSPARATASLPFDEISAFAEAPAYVAAQKRAVSLKLSLQNAHAAAVRDEGMGREDVSDILGRQVVLGDFQSMKLGQTANGRQDTRRVTSDTPSASCGSFGSGEHSRLCKLISVDLIVRTGLQASVG
jgi:hypothetical protein